MKKFLVVFTAFTALAGVASAAPLCLANQSIAFYEATYTNLASACQIGDKLFYAFNYGSVASGGAIAPDATQVFVTPDPSNASEPGLVFTSSGWTVSGTSGSANADVISIDSNIGFNVQTVSGLPQILDASLDFTGFFSTTGGGQALIGETVSFTGPQPAVGLSVDSNNGPFRDVKEFAGVSNLRVTKDLQVRIARTQTGTATITEFREGFSESPEPVSTFLMASGLLGLGFWRRRR